MTPRILAAAAMLLASEAHGQGAPRIAITHHVGHFNGQTTPYTATVAETFVSDAKGAPAASVITIAYTREGVTDPATRPVLFCFNGGPGASSSPTHTQALGPMVRGDQNLGDQSGGGFHENTSSPLDAVDLVFIDPVGTGFSRPLPGVDAKPFYSVSGDAREVKEVMEAWLKANHREASPRFMLGESYGTNRAAAIVKGFQDFRLDGVMLVALAAGAPGREMPYVTALPTMAAGAWHHQKIERKGRSVRTGVQRIAGIRPHRLCHRAHQGRQPAGGGEAQDRCQDVVADRPAGRADREGRPADQQERVHVQPAEG